MIMVIFGILVKANGVNYEYNRIAWLKVNGVAIYGTSAGPCKKTPAWGRTTRRHRKPHGIHARDHGIYR